ncbi:MAG: 23S rRNA (pseudouridine(1915)-N(3))-methyltransferase RlmH [Quisquiliibacterium sp.]
MQIRIIAVGTRMPSWVQTAVDDYRHRMPPELRLEWKEVRAEQRSARESAAVWMAREAQRIRAALPAQAGVVVLDEHGQDLDTRGFAKRLKRWQLAARPVAILIGGPDGLDPGLKAQAHETIRLSSLTLAHPLVRVMLAEQLYRAWSVLADHPYHRD